MKKFKAGPKFWARFERVVLWALLPLWIVALPFVAVSTAREWYDPRHTLGAWYEYQEALRFEANCLVHKLTGNYSLFIFK